MFFTFSGSLRRASLGCIRLAVTLIRCNAAACRPGRMTSTPVKEFIETEVRGGKFRVPKSYYDLDGAAWKRALDLMEQAEDYDDGAQRFDRTSLVFPDQQSATARCITSLESEVETMVDVVGRLQQQLNWRQEAVELQCNQSLLEQEVGLVGVSPFVGSSSP